MRRVSCPIHGIVVEEVPWCSGKNHLTNVYMQFLANWARKLSWLDVARSFNTSWEKVYRSIEYVVNWGLERRDLSNIKSIGVDEIARSKGHKYLTLVYQIDANMTRLLWVGKERTEEVFNTFFDFLGEEASNNIQYICSDMWKPYLKVIRQRCSQALNILDRFHIVSKMNEALDDVRAQEARRLAAKGKDYILSKTRWCLLKRPENLTDKQSVRLKELVACNILTVKAYLLKEAFQQLWTYVSPAWAEKFIDAWCKTVRRTRINPMKKIEKMIRKHKGLILNWFKVRGRLSSGVIEGLNNKAKVTIRKSYGFRNPDVLKMALFHVLGKLPVPQTAHKFY